MYEPIQNKNTSQLIVDQIKNMILSGKLKIGDKLPPERELAELYKVSRTSVREALKALEAIGVLEIRQGGGIYIVNDILLKMSDNASLVFSLSGGTLEDLTNFRYSFELAAINILYKEFPDNITDAFKKFAERIENAKTQSEVMNIDLEIHKFIPSTISNPIFEYIYNTIETLYNKNIEFRNALGPSWDDIPLEHTKAFLLNLINGILSRDIATLEKALNYHYFLYPGFDNDSLYEEFVVYGSNQADI